jgi:hypothetical protein
MVDPHFGKAAADGLHVAGIPRCEPVYSRRYPHDGAPIP